MKRMRPQNRHDSLIVTAVILAVLAVLAFYFMDKLAGDEDAEINSFEECVAAQGGQITLTYPPMCTSPDGRTFTE